MFKESLKYSRKSKLYLFGAVLLIAVSCKKDKLKDEYEILVGRWEWVYSIYEQDKCQQSGGFSTIINPNTEGTTFQMQFFEKGRLKFFENNVLIDEYRIVMDGWQPWQGSQPFSQDAINFVIYLDNNEETKFSGLVAGDSIVTFKRPYEGPASLCEEYENYWGRVK